ncbi:MAG TPA: hypothetical protein VKY92_06905 [Verrucomicrobiae bacterium]|jgi:hypothetical protein|nr:hypothetical protein [Verrucomicrobiae bacterium]
MNSEYEKQLELEVNRELQQLADLPAPATLAKRVRLAIEQRRRIKWYMQPWQNWPMPLRVGALALLLTMFGGLCFVSWRLTRAAGFAAALEEVGALFSGLNSIWNVINVLFGAVVLVFKHLGTGFLLGCAAIAGLAYALCIGLGTAWVRLAFARR